MSPISSLVVSAALTWTMLVVASFARLQGWTLPGMRNVFGNRGDVPASSAFAARADRAAYNMVENLVLFATLLLAASLSNVNSAELDAPCAIFVACRFVHAPLYWAGVRYLRTLVWMISLVGLVWIGALAMRCV